jgi:hypothetical protein
MSIKAFDLVPAIERVHLMSEKAKTQVLLFFNFHFYIFWVVKKILGGLTEFKLWKHV